jgi:hypothetical protein
MKVKELVKKLKRMPQDLELGWQDHDASDYEISSYPREVLLWSKKEYPRPSYVNDRYEVERYKSNPVKCVVIRP